MRSQKLNSEVALTPKERKELLDILVKAGIDKELAGTVFGRIEGDGGGCGKKDNCCHGGFGNTCKHDNCVHNNCKHDNCAHGCPTQCKHDACDSYFRVGRKDIDHLLDVLKQKNINPKALGKFEAKFMK
ncbi:hypothetical protein [Butyrivibrio fibrisolvens]|uniref:Uncharacterized protein n=1 Tax=Butyrivibrio fibrisolvens TaxID=831 RepID=A0A1H9X142_BUTFI|nr:hypothetical protein [Butyrivibrio fibrisolvens]SES39850.1 hypothetical protein SAMN04487884_13914 [Butyrivibrio fibrisolvens]